MAMNEQAKPARQSSTVRNLLMAGLIGGALLACAPIIDQRGYVFDDRLIERLEIGKTNIDQTLAILGSPSTTSEINGKAFYYIHSRFVRESYRATKEVERKVMAIYFDRQSNIRDMAVYGLDDGIIIEIVQHTTESQWAELSIIGQLFSNAGRFGDGGVDGGL
jgi:outer membrane protein assembly factor BamE (lipoprotein component of BamABCDE complex)